MEVSRISEGTCKCDSFDDTKKGCELDHRKIKILTSAEGPLTVQFVNNNLHHPPTRMSRPDRGEIDFTYGYDEERGGFIEGRISASWGESKSSSESSDEKIK